MSNNPDPSTDPVTEESSTINQLLRDPTVWAEPSDGVGDSVLAAILAEQASTAAPAPIENNWPPPTQPEQRAITNVVDFERPASEANRRRVRRWLPIAAAAALAIIALGSVAALSLRSSADPDDPDLQTVALAPSDLAPQGTVTAEVVERPNGVRIVLDLSGLPPAPDGFFYQAWLVRPEPRNAVSAGTFHLRGGDGSIELWAGVSTEEYTTLSVTLSPESDPTSPGDRLFAAEL
ncbi:MAG: anti-sigma factor [Acidimicrobiales bacterium]